MNAQRRKFRSIVLAAAAAVLACAPAARPATAKSIQAASLLSVQSGHSVVLRTAGLSRVAVGDGRFDKYAQAQKYVMVNAVTVAHPIGDIQQQIASVHGAHDIRVDPDGKGNVIVSGSALNTVVAAAILEKAKGLAGSYLAADGKLIDRISVTGHSQVSIK